MARFFFAFFTLFHLSLTFFFDRRFPLTGGKRKHMWEDSHWVGWVSCYFTCEFACPVLLQQLLSNKASNFWQLLNLY